MTWKEYYKENSDKIPKEFADKEITVEDCLKIMDVMSFTIKELFNKTKWHTGTPTEKGMYYVTDGRGNYDVTYWLIVSVEDEEDDEGEWDSTCLDKIVAYQKIKPYKGEA